MIFISASEVGAINRKYVLKGDLSHFSELLWPVIESLGLPVESRPDLLVELLLLLLEGLHLGRMVGYLALDFIDLAADAMQIVTVGKLLIH